jgi:CDP-4-dehydro-6-deoxyglucose reductase
VRDLVAPGDAGPGDAGAPGAMPERGQIGAHGPDPWVATSERAPYRVQAIRPCTPTIVELRLAPPAEPLAYCPGQYVLLEDDQGAIAPRSYSIANAPRPGGVISLLITRVPGGQAGTWVHERLAIGEQVRVSGPYGTFVDDPASTAPVVFLAAGSGLAPIRALLEAAVAMPRHPALTLVFSARGEADLIDREDFARLQRREPRFRFIRTLTREAGPPPRGRIPGTLATLVGDLGDHDVFVAGAPGFVTACAAAAEALGTSRARLHTEVF